MNNVEMTSTTTAAGRTLNDLTDKCRMLLGVGQGGVEIGGDDVWRKLDTLIKEARERRRLEEAARIPKVGDAVLVQLCLFVDSNSTEDNPENNGYSDYPTFMMPAIVDGIRDDGFFELGVKAFRVIANPKYFKRDVEFAGQWRGLELPGGLEI
jgi:hypothetical protein